MSLRQFVQQGQHLRLGVLGRIIVDVPFVTVLTIERWLLPFAGAFRDGIELERMLLETTFLLVSHRHLN